MDCSYRVRIGSKAICFCDRVVEASSLLTMFERGSTFPKAIYGPEGCGKTTLLKYLVHRVSEVDSAIAVYTDALKGNDPAEAVFSSVRATYEVASAIAVELPIGMALAEKVLQLFKRLHERISLRGKKVLLVVDDVYRAIGLESAERYTKSMCE